MVSDFFIPRVMHCFCVFFSTSCVRKKPDVFVSGPICLGCNLRPVDYPRGRGGFRGPVCEGFELDSCSSGGCVGVFGVLRGRVFFVQVVKDPFIDVRLI